MTDHVSVQVDCLLHMIANLQEYIDRRAGELAAPHIAAAGVQAGEEVAAARSGQQRAEDLVTELRRQFAALERNRDSYRQRAERAEATIRRVHAAAKVPGHLDPAAHPVTLAGYRACAERVTTAMFKEPG